MSPPPQERRASAPERLAIRDTTALVGRDLTIAEHVDIVIVSGKIERIGRGEAETASRVFDGRGLVALPGFVNAHVHLNDAPLRDAGIGMSLDELVNPLSGLKRKGLRAIPLDARVRSMSMALDCMVKSGTTTAVNFHEEGRMILEMLRERSSNACILLNLGRPRGYFSRTRVERNECYGREEIEEFRKELPFFDGTGLSGANEYSDSALEQISENSHGMRSIHAAESAETVSHSMKMTGRTETQRIAEHYRPDFIIHMTHAGADDIRLIRELGASVVCCPRSNGILGTGVPPLRELRLNGIMVGLGTDNVMLNEPDMFREMDFTSRVLRGSARDPSAIDSVSILRMATTEGAAAIGIGGRTGSIEHGKEADIVLLDSGGGLAGTHDIYSSIVHRATTADVAATIKQGVFLHAKAEIQRYQ